MEGLPAGGPSVLGEKKSKINGNARKKVVMGSAWLLARHRIRATQHAIRDDELSWCWAATLIIGILDIAWISITDLSARAIPYISLASAVVLFIGSRQPAVLEKPRLSVFLRVFSLFLLMWPAFRAFNHLVMTLPFPYTDKLLAGIAPTFGFHWLDYLFFVDKYPALLSVLDISYSSLTGVSLLSCTAILFFCGPERLVEFVKLFVLTALSCTILGAAFPAQAAMIFHAVPPGLLQNIDPHTGTYHIAHLEGLRNDPAHTLDFRNLPGLTTFPSFHTSMGFVIMYCCRSRLMTASVAVIYSLTMVASTPVFGSHYLVDLVAGAAVAGIAVIILRTGRAHTRLTQKDTARFVVDVPKAEPQPGPSPLR